MGFTRNQLMSRTWRYGTDRRNPVTSNLRLLPDGSIEGYSHPNEKTWLLDDLGQLCFYHESGQLSLCFDTVNRLNTRVWMSGKHRFSDKPLILHLESVIPGMDPHFHWTERALEDKILKYGWDIGEYTYGVPNIQEENQAKLTIGRFCSIGPGVVIALSDHRMDSFTTYPFSTLKHLWPNAAGLDDHANTADVVIGSDVWLAADSIITSGVTIGHGAVIGGGSVVTKDVPPYAIVGGNPARILRYRHDEATIARLLDIAWWNWPYEKVNQNLAAIMATDVDVLQNAAAVEA